MDTARHGRGALVLACGGLMLSEIPPSPGDVVTDLTHWPVVVVRPPSRPMTDAEFRDYLAWVGKYVSGRGEPYAIVNDARRAAPVTAQQRRMLAEQMERLKPITRRYCAGTALVFDSALMRGVLTAIFWMSTPEYPTKVCKSIDEALAWCEVRLGYLQHEHARERRHS